MSKYCKEENALRYGLSVKKMRDKYIISCCPHLALSGISAIPADNPDKKRLYASISRARSHILELAYCNNWDYFITITFDKEKVKSRYTISDTMGALRRWINQRNKAGDCIKYLLVPELHADGAIHCHGLISGNIKTKPFKEYAPREVPEKLRKTDYHNIPLLSTRFGWCSAGHIQNAEAVSYYMSKYITKNVGSVADVLNSGAHIYYASQGLKKAEKIGVFHKDTKDACASIPWTWRDDTTGQASITLKSLEDVKNILYDWEIIK